MRSDVYSLGAHTVLPLDRPAARGGGRRRGAARRAAGRPYAPAAARRDDRPGARGGLQEGDGAPAGGPVRVAPALAEDVERWAADEPVSAWREPFGRRARRWAKRNRTAVTGAAVALIAGVVGLSAVLAVQTRANAALAAANAELTRSKAAVQDRYDLAVEAIKTFHTGVSEDFLLKQDQFKELRDRLLKSAADFYGKLGALLGKETDFASRRALAQANFEVADLTAKVGRNEDALAAHRAVLARREALAAEPGADAEAKADVGRSLTAVAFLLESTGKTAEAEATYRRAESLLAGLAVSSPAARAALATCRARLGSLLPRRASPPPPWRRTAWRGPTRRRRPPPPRQRTRPGATWRPRFTASAFCCRRRASRRRLRPSTARRWRSIGSWPTTTPPSPNSAAAWRASHFNLGSAAVEHGQVGGGGGRVPAGAGDPAEAGR